jgi:hypothetical protein
MVPLLTPYPAAQATHTVQRGTVPMEEPLPHPLSQLEETEIPGNAINIDCILSRLCDKNRGYNCVYYCEQCDVSLFEIHPLCAEITGKYSKSSGLILFQKREEDSYSCFGRKTWTHWFG